ncbi:hypothetical protein PAPHI01_1528 [Pancytospora philotis]|nr:hypothetical protein PAPHI01_1528 [Pancytospora philotis]
MILSLRIKSPRNFRRLLFSQNSKISRVRRLIVIELITGVLRVTSISAILYIERDKTVAASLVLLLIGYCILNAAQTIRFYLKSRVFFEIQRIRDYEVGSNMMLLSSLFDGLILAWYVTSLRYFREFGACRVTNPLLYYTSIFWILCGVCSFVAPLLGIDVLTLLEDYLRLRLKAIKYLAEHGITYGNSICIFDDPFKRLN